MATAWFICPYDLALEQPRPCLTCAVARYLPVESPRSRATWSAIDIANGYALAKVSATPALLTTIAADPAFFDVTTTVSQPAKDLLLTLGYTTDDLRGTRDQILRALTIVRTPILGISGGTVIYGPRTPRSDNVAALDAQVS